MPMPLEAVPNFSEGRDAATIDALGTALAERAELLDVHTDADHNRSVFTLVGDDGAIVTRSSPASPWRASGSTCAATRARTRGSALRTSCRSCRSSPATWSGPAPLPGVWQSGSVDELSLPVFLYGELAPGRGPAFFRRGGTAELARRLESGELVPDFGPARLDERAGGVIVGARRPLIAFNVDLVDADLGVAREIAAVVRERDGGFPGVRALGLELPRAGRVQVSMNVEDWEAAALHEIVARIETEAAARGARVAGAELVGLMPAGAAAAAAGAQLRIAGFDASHVLELRLLERDR